MSTMEQPASPEMPEQSELRQPDKMRKRPNPTPPWEPAAYVYYPPTEKSEFMNLVLGQQPLRHSVARRLSYMANAHCAQRLEQARQHNPFFSSMLSQLYKDTAQKYNLVPEAELTLDLNEYEIIAAATIVNKLPDPDHAESMLLRTIENPANLTSNLTRAKNLLRRSRDGRLAIPISVLQMAQDICESDRRRLARQHTLAVLYGYRYLPNKTPAASADLPPQFGAA